MGAEDIHIALDKQEMKRVKLQRCALCGIDKELLFAQIFRVNQKTLDHLKELATEYSCLTILNQTKHIPVIDAVIDDMTLKLIDGMGYQVSFRMCKKCLEKIAHRHKYKKSCVYATA